MEDSRLNIDNNRAERTVKSFVIGRKNWLFNHNHRGAEASAILYSIIETAKANGLTRSITSNTAWSSYLMLTATSIASYPGTLNLDQRSISKSNNKTLEQVSSVEQP